MEKHTTADDGDGNATDSNECVDDVMNALWTTTSHQRTAEGSGGLERWRKQRLQVQKEHPWTSLRTRGNWDPLSIMLENFPRSRESTT